jgi:RNA-directed DNA polymerase
MMRLRGQSVLRERFNFLGYSFGPYCYKGNGQWYLSAGVSKKSVQRLKAKVANLLTPGNHDPWLDVHDALNSFLFGWARYFSYGTLRAAFHR